jgi:hypothetical protein
MAEATMTGGMLPACAIVNDDFRGPGRQSVHDWSTLDNAPPILMKSLYQAIEWHMEFISVPILKRGSDDFA